MEWKSKDELKKSQDETNAILLREYRIREILETLNEKHPVRNSISEKEKEEIKKLFEVNPGSSPESKRKFEQFIITIMRLMGLKENKVKIINYINEDKFPKSNAAAFVSLPKNNMPLFGTTAFNNLTIPIHIKKSLLYKSLDTIVYVIAHELSHIVLHSTKNSLKDSEVATDLYVMICGFSYIMKEGRIGHEKSSMIEYGYLSYSELHYAIKYVEELHIKNITNIDNLERGNF